MRRAAFMSPDDITAVVIDINGGALAAAELVNGKRAAACGCFLGFLGAARRDKPRRYLTSLDAPA